MSSKPARSWAPAFAGATIFLVLGFAQAGSISADVSSPDMDAAKREWSPVLAQIGIEEGKTIAPDKFALVLGKLATLPPICQKIRQSSVKPIALADWIHILKGLGVEPKPEMSESDWALLLGKAGVDVSKGVSAPLPQGTKAETVAPAPVPAVAPAKAGAQTADGRLGPGFRRGDEVAGLRRNDELDSGLRRNDEAVPAPKKITKTLSLDLRGMDVNEVLKLIARQGDLNMIVAASVHGTVTLLLKDVEVWEALRQVLDATDLAYAFDGKVVRVITSADYEKLYGVRFDDQTVVEPLPLKNVKASAMSKYLENVKSRVGKIVVYDYSNALVLIDTPEAIEKMKQMAETFDRQMETRVFTLNYAKAKELLPKITPLVSKEVGEIEMDERTNRIIVMDYPDHIRQVDAFVQAFDERHRAVLIEAKIVQVQLTSNYQWGVNWGYVLSHVGREFIPAGLTGNFTQFPIVAPGIPTNGPGTSGPGAQGPTAFTASVGALNQNNFTSVIQALQTIGKTNLLSAPRISVVNNETANILVGTKQAYVTTTVLTPGVGAAQTSEQINFIDVGVKLHVTPTIGDDGFITMKIKPEVSSVSSTLTTASGNTVPIVATTQAETSVLVKDGETLLLGGLIENDRTVTDTGVPILSRIPLLGLLFKSRNKTGTKSELSVFLTPRIQTETASLPSPEIPR